MTVSGTPNNIPPSGSHRVGGPTAAQSSGSVESSAKPRGGSRVDVSDSARQMSELSQLVRNAPDTRTDLVNDIKQRIESGTYEVNLDKLAEKLSDVL